MWLEMGNRMIDKFLISNVTHDVKFKAPHLPSFDFRVLHMKMWSLEFHIAWHIWNSKSIYIILFPISNHIHHDYNYNLIIFCQIQKIWRTLKSKEGRYGALNLTSWVTFEIQNPYLSSYSPFPIGFIMMIIII